VPIVVDYCYIIMMMMMMMVTVKNSFTLHVGMHEYGYTCVSIVMEIAESHDTIHTTQVYRSMRGVNGVISFNGHA